MKSGWDTAKELAEKHASGIFIRLQNDQDLFVGKICGEPYAQEMHWTGEGYAECTGKGCARCGKDKVTTRVKLNIYVLNEHGMKIFECGPAVFKTLLAIRDKYGIDKYLFEVKRHGAAKSPKTKYSILPDTPLAELTAAERAEIASAALHNLETAEDETEETLAPTPPARTDPNAKLSDAAIGEFRERLKRFPKDVGLYPVLGAFGAERISDIPGADEHKARGLIERIERGEKLGPPPPAELDEFS